MAYLREMNERSSLPSIHAVEHDYLRSSSSQSSRRRAWSPHSYNDVSYYPSALSTEKLQEQLKYLKEEVTQKDRLIRQLTVPRRKVMTGDFSGLDNSFLVTTASDGNTFDRLPYSGGDSVDFGLLSSGRARLDGASRMRIESLQNQVRELKAELQTKDGKIRELKSQYEACKESEMKQNCLITSLKERLTSYEAQFGMLEGQANRSGMAVTTLQKDNEESQHRILELESRLRTHLEERERAEQERQMIERKFSEIYHQFSGLCVSADLAGAAPTTEQIIDRVKELVFESHAAKGQLVTMKEHIENVECELRASRDTVARLIADSERGEISKSRCTLDIENAHIERDRAVGRACQLERELFDMRERLEKTQRAWATMRREFETQQNSKSSAEYMSCVEGQARAFKECLSTLLCEAGFAAEPFEEVIRDRVHQLVQLLRDKEKRIGSLEHQLSDSLRQLSSQMEISQSVVRKKKRAEADAADLEERLRQTEAWSSAQHETAVHNPATDKCISLLEKLNRTMDMRPFPVGLPIDSACDAVLSRAAELYAGEEELDARRTHIVNLQRKVRSLKEQLNCKEELLKIESDKDKEGENKNKKLVKLVEKYKIELNETYCQLQELRTQLADSAKFMEKFHESENQLENYERKITELESNRQKFQQKIREQERFLDDLRESSEKQKSSMKSEMNSMKNSLEESISKYKQMFELRRIISRMLGLNDQPRGDMEIVQRLEKLILANKATQDNTLLLDSNLQDLISGYKNVYSSHHYTDVQEPQMINLGERKSSDKRSRSASPSKRRDTKMY